MRLAPAARAWNLPVIATAADLADFLGCHQAELAWFAHGFTRGRSIKTFVEPHTGCHALLHLDLQDYFPSFASARTRAFFRTLGYPETVAGLLTGLCTTSAPRPIWQPRNLNINLDERQRARELYGRRHLPQGAPTSPALVNLCSYRLDCRLNGLAHAAAAAYTRYADDLAFSGDRNFLRSIEHFSARIAAIAHEEGFAVNHRKTRIMPAAVSQHLAGLVVDEFPNVKRAEYDRSKATLTNCVQTGPATQNRDRHPAFRQHLEGKVAFVQMVNPARASRHRQVLAQISWNKP